MSKVPTMVAPAPTLVQIMGECFTIVIPSCLPGTLGYPAVTPIHVPKAGLGLLHVRSECIYVTLWFVFVRMSVAIFCMVLSASSRKMCVTKAGPLIFS